MLPIGVFVLACVVTRSYVRGVPLSIVLLRACLYMVLQYFVLPRYACLPFLLVCVRSVSMPFGVCVCVIPCACVSNHVCALRFILFMHFASLLCERQEWEGHGIKGL